MKRLLGTALIAAMTLAVVPPSFAQQAAPAAPAAATTAPQTGSTGKDAKATTKKDLTPQQKKMKDCSREAKFKGLKGDPRKQFMSTCLKGD